MSQDSQDKERLALGHPRMKKLKELGFISTKKGRVESTITPYC